jgi:hypothetical protein
MYGEHDVFKTPPDPTIIWRYTTWGRLCDVLAKNALFFARATVFDDPWEACYPEHQYTLESTAEKWAHLVQGSPETLAHMHEQTLRQLRLFDEGRHENGVSCWHMAAGESDNHWRIYGRNDEGVAIRSTIGKLKLALEACRDRIVYIGGVSYIDFDTAFVPEGNGFWPIVHKRLAFRHDQEVRAVVWEGERLAVPFGERGVYVPIDVAALVEEVVLSPLAAPSFVEPVTETIRRFALTCPVRRSELLDPPRYRSRRTSVSS